MIIDVTRKLVIVKTPLGLGTVVAYDTISKEVVVRDGSTLEKKTWKPNQVEVQQ